MDELFKRLQRNLNFMKNLNEKLQNSNQRSQERGYEWQTNQLEDHFILNDEEIMWR